MKTKTIILLASKIDAMVVSINDFIPSESHDNLMSYYHRATNAFGELIFECTYYWLVHQRPRYDKRVLQAELTQFQWEMFKTLEQQYLSIILFGGGKYTNVMTKEIATQMKRNLN